MLMTHLDTHTLLEGDFYSASPCYILCGLYYGLFIENNFYAPMLQMVGFV